MNGLLKATGLYDMKCLHQHCAETLPWLLATGRNFLYGTSGFQDYRQKISNFMEAAEKQIFKYPRNYGLKNSKSTFLVLKTLKFKTVPGQTAF
jgi:hypothetical protein